ncbi:MAG TPA: HAD-IIA family hydrolase [Gemmatimonadales bacterium]|nr:HAD-IIA family hydrolase [Gemmatimonadales bacterium]
MSSAYLFDLDGTLYTAAGPVPGAVERLRELRRRRIPHRYVTNTTSRPRAAIVERLRGYGFDASADEVFTAVMAGAQIARTLGCRTVAPFLPPATLVDLGEFELQGGMAGPPARRDATPDAVIVGDLGDRWDFALMQEAFRYLMGGAALIALSRDRYWLRGDGLALDAGPFVVGLEYAAGKEAIVAGKPSRDFFVAAVASLGSGVDPADVVVVGDDVWSDVRGAQDAGCQGWLVRTGKFSERAVIESGIRPDRILESVAQLEVPAPL